jgi:serine/threonine protein kinase
MLGDDAWDTNQLCRDLKSANVFLDLPQVNHYPLHPKPIMGDYGIAIKTSENDPLNPLFYRNFGPKGYTPPEQLDTVDRRNLTTLDNFRLDEATNVRVLSITLLRDVTRCNDVSLRHRWLVF